MDNKKHRMIVMALVFLFIIAPTVEGFAIDSQFQRETLKGLQGVLVAIENIDPVAQKDGLTKDLLQTDVELQLRKSGIKVLTEEETYKTSGRPILYVKVSLLKHGAVEIYAYEIEVQLEQTVYLMRNPNIGTLAVTWDIENIGMVGTENMKTSIRGHVKDHVDKFINAYLAMNPK